MPCDTPVRQISDRARVDLPATFSEPARHHFRIDGDFSDRRANERVVIVTEEGRYWDQRLNAMATHVFVQRFPEVTRRMDHRIYAETPALPPGRYALAIAYDITSRPESPLFVLSTVVQRFEVR
jgi:hypothetical protein